LQQLQGCASVAGMRTHSLSNESLQGKSMSTRSPLTVVQLVSERIINEYTVIKRPKDPQW
jgi:hypothetical protein